MDRGLLITIIAVSKLFNQLYWDVINFSSNVFAPSILDDFSFKGIRNGGVGWGKVATPPQPVAAGRF